MNKGGEVYLYTVVTKSFQYLIIKQGNNQVYRILIMFLFEREIMLFLHKDNILLSIGKNHVRSVVLCVDSFV